MLLAVSSNNEIIKITLTDQYTELKTLLRHCSLSSLRIWWPSNALINISQYIDYLNGLCELFSSSKMVMVSISELSKGPGFSVRIPSLPAFLTTTSAHKTSYLSAKKKWDLSKISFENQRYNGESSSRYWFTIINIKILQFFLKSLSGFEMWNIVYWPTSVIFQISCLQYGIFSWAMKTWTGQSITYIILELKDYWIACDLLLLRGVKKNMEWALMFLIHLCLHSLKRSSTPCEIRITAIWLTRYEIKTNAIRLVLLR